MFRYNKLSIFFAAALIYISVLPLRAENGGQAFIGSIKFTGVKELKVGDIKKMMDTEFPNWFPFAKQAKLDESVLRNDMNNIETYYQANGFFDASAAYKIMKEKKNSPAKIAVNIIEGSPSLVNKITLSTIGQEKAFLAKLKSLVTLERGKCFKYELYEASKKSLQVYLNENGYGSAVVSGKAIVNKQARTVDVVYNINEGALQHFGKVTVNGNVRVKMKDIIAELTFKSGEIYSSTKLDQSRVNIFNLGLFRLVSVTPAVSSGSAVVPINIEVAEGDKRQLRLGLGYGPEVKIRTSVQWSRNYLWDRPRTLTFGAIYSAIDENLTAKIFQPYFLDRKNNLTITGTLDREKAVSYTNEKISSQLQVKRNFTDKFSIFTAYNLEVNRPTNLEDVLLSDILASTPDSSYFISSFSAGLNYVFVDDPAYPSHGGSYSLYLEPATFLLGSQVDYLKGVTECHLYGLLLKDLILSTRFKLGFIRPSRFTTDIPIFKRFFSGGSYSVRGYGFQQIGPKDPAGNPVGGQYLFEDNVELHYPIKGKFKGVVFVDSGDVYQSSFSFNSDSLSYGTGTGVRYLTPIGPIGIDLAFPIQNFRSIDLGSYYFYLTIGMGF
jgi:outer membrane protein insertion porin family/translocation and assembly module TamA